MFSAAIWIGILQYSHGRINRCQTVIPYCFYTTPFLSYLSVYSYVACGTFTLEWGLISVIKAAMVYHSDLQVQFNPIFIFLCFSRVLLIMEKRLPKPLRLRNPQPRQQESLHLFRRNQSVFSQKEKQIATLFLKYEYGIATIFKA